MSRPPILVLTAILGVILLGSCSHPDERLTRMAKESADRQAEQNRQMAELQQEVAAGSRAAIEADAEARKHFSELQAKLQTEQATIGHQRDLLEEERRQAAEERRQSSVMAAAIVAATTMFVGVLPLVLCWYLLRSPPADEDAGLLADTLIEELAAESPRLLGPSPPSLPRLPPGGEAESNPPP